MPLRTRRQNRKRLWAVLCCRPAGYGFRWEGVEAYREYSNCTLAIYEITWRFQFRYECCMIYVSDDDRLKAIELAEIVANQESE